MSLILWCRIITGGMMIKVDAMHPKSDMLIRSPKYLIGMNDAKVSIIMPETIDTVDSMIGLPVSMSVFFIASTYSMSPCCLNLSMKWIASSTPQPIAMDVKVTVIKSNGIDARYMNT